MHQKFPQSSIVLRLFVLILACFFSAVAAMAQEKITNIGPSAQPQASGSVGTTGVAETKLPATDSAPLKTTTKLAPTALTPVTKSNDSKAPASTPVTKSDDSAATGTANASND